MSIFFYFYVSVFYCLQVKIPQDENSRQSTTNGKIANGNSQARGNPDREEEGEDKGKQNPHHRGVSSKQVKI